MYNELEYDLAVLDLPNIVYAHKKGEIIPIVAHPFLRPLLIKLAKARPKWRLIGTRYTVRGGDEANWATYFTVYEGNEALGTIRKSYNYGTSQDVFAIDNKRMSDKRQRGNATTTKDVAKAFKIITREFHGKTTDELVREASNVLSTAISHVANQARSEYQGRVSRMSEACLAFATDHWDTFAQFAREKGVAGVTLDTFHEAKQNRDDGVALTDAVNGRTGMLVVLRGDDYIVQHNGATTILSSDQLTPHMKRCIGMLKLADKGAFIPGMGVKGGPDAMFIMPEPKGDEGE